MVTQHVPHEVNRYRWYVLRYVRTCTYPASTGELSEALGPRVGACPSHVKKTIRERDLLVLADCGAIKYDPVSQLVCLPDDRDSFVDCIRRALEVGAISHLKPPRLDWLLDTRRFTDEATPRE